RSRRSRRERLSVRSGSHRVRAGRLQRADVRASFVRSGAQLLDDRALRPGGSLRLGGRRGRRSRRDGEASCSTAPGRLDGVDDPRGPRRRVQPVSPGLRRGTPSSTARGVHGRARAVLGEASRQSLGSRRAYDGAAAAGIGELLRARPLRPRAARTLRSVLDQEYPDLEYIVVDGGSTDDTVSILQRYDDRIAYWTSEPDRGQTDAINKGLARATGDVVAYINSDDYYLPGAFDAALPLFADQAVDWVAGACRFVFPDG